MCLSTVRKTRDHKQAQKAYDIMTSQPSFPPHDVHTPTHLRRVVSTTLPLPPSNSVPTNIHLPLPPPIKLIAFIHLTDKRKEARKNGCILSSSYTYINQAQYNYNTIQILHYIRPHYPPHPPKVPDQISLEGTYQLGNPSIRKRRK